MHSAQTKYSNIFFYKTTVATVVKFHIENDLAPGFQNCKNGLGRTAKVAAVTKDNKNNKINLSSRTQNILANLRHGIPTEHGYYELQK